MAIQHRLTASPQTLQERTQITHDPVAAKRAQWFIDNFENGFEKQLKLNFDPVMTSSDRITFRSQPGTLQQAERCVDWMTHTGMKFQRGTEGPSSPYVMISERKSVAGQRVYFAVFYYTRGIVTVVCQW